MIATAGATNRANEGQRRGSVTRRCSIGSGQGPAVIAMMWKAAAAIDLKRSPGM